MKIRWNLLCLAALFTIGAGMPARATNVRVDNLGQAGLLPDDEADLNQAGAFIYDIPDERLFATVAAKRDRSMDSDSGGSLRAKEVSLGAMLEFVGGSAAWPYAVRYTPQYTDSKEIDSTAGFERRRFRNIANLRLILGLGRGDGWKWALSPTYEDSYFSFRRPVGTTERTGDVLGLEASLLTGEKGSARTAASLRISQTALTTESGGTTSGELDQQILSAAIIPERPCGEGVCRFLLRGSMVETDTEDPSSSPLVSGDSSSQGLDLGFGWSGRPGGDGLWHTSFLVSSFNTDGETQVGTPPDIEEIERTLTGTWRAGVEKSVATGVLLRASVDLLRHNDTRFSSNFGERGSERATQLIAGTALGLGLKPSESVDLDLSFGTNTATAEESHTRDPGSFSDRTFNGIFVEVAADFRF